MSYKNGEIILEMSIKDLRVLSRCWTNRLHNTFTFAQNDSALIMNAWTAIRMMDASVK